MTTNKRGILDNKEASYLSPAKLLRQIEEAEASNRPGLGYKADKLTEESGEDNDGPNKDLGDDTIDDEDLGPNPEPEKANGDGDDKYPSLNDKGVKMMSKLVKLGFGVNEAQEVYQQGITTVDDLAMMDNEMEKDILSRSTMYDVTAMAKAKFWAFCKWAVQQFDKGFESATPADFTTAECRKTLMANRKSDTTTTPVFFCIYLILYLYT